MFQSATPKIRVLHDELIRLYQVFLSNYVKAESINAEQLGKLDVSAVEHHKAAKKYFVGQEARDILKTFTKEDQDSTCMRSFP